MLLHLVVLPWVVNWISKVSATVTEYWHFNVHSSQTFNSNLNPRFSCGRVSNGLKLKLNSTLSGGQPSSQQFFRLEVANPCKLHMISLFGNSEWRCSVEGQWLIIGEPLDYRRPPQAHFQQRFMFVTKYYLKLLQDFFAVRWEDRYISYLASSTVKNNIEVIVLGSHCVYLGCLDWW